MQSQSNYLPRLQPWSLPAFAAAAAAVIFAATLQEIVAKVPRHYEKIVRIVCMRFGFRHNRNVRSWCEASKLVFIYFGDARQLGWRDAAKLENHVPLRRGAIAEHS